MILDVVDEMWQMLFIPSIVWRANIDDDSDVTILGAFPTLKEAVRALGMEIGTIGIDKPFNCSLEAHNQSSNENTTADVWLKMFRNVKTPEQLHHLCRKHFGCFECGVYYKLCPMHMSMDYNHNWIWKITVIDNETQESTHVFSSQQQERFIDQL